MLGQNARDVEALFRRVRPTGPLTPIGARLEHMLSDYTGEIIQAKIHGPNTLKKFKPVNYIVITDGAASMLFTQILGLFFEAISHLADDPDYTLPRAAKRLDDNNFPLSQVCALIELELFLQSTTTVL